MSTRLLNPTPEQLRAALADTVQREYDEQGQRAPAHLPDPAPLLAEPPAVWLHFLADHRQGFRNAHVLVTRWRDPLGCVLWLIECEYEPERMLRFPPARRAGTWQALPEPPLRRLAPPDRYVERHRPYRLAQPLGICRCGAVGTPEQIAWRGTQCGPCHDRETEGELPVGPFVPAASQKILLGDEHGWIVSENRTVSSLDHGGRWIWSRDGEGMEGLGGRRPWLLLGQERHLCLIDSQTGAEVERWRTNWPIQYARVLDEETILTVHHVEMCWWKRGHASPEYLVPIRHAYPKQTTCDPTGRLIVLPTVESLECFDHRGNYIRTLVSSVGWTLRYPIAVSPTHVLCLQPSTSGQTLYTWELPPSHVPGTLASRQSRPVGKASELTLLPGSPSRALLWFASAIEVIDPETLTAPITLTFPGRETPELTPVGPDHVLLQGTRENLLVPWRDLLGLEATRNL